MSNKSLTDEWVVFYGNPDNQNGITWRLIGMGKMSYGVNYDDPRVKELMDKAKTNYQTGTKS